MWNLEDIYGTRVEHVSCQAVDTGLFAAMKLVGNIKGIYVGHDHDNDFWGDYNGIKLHYGRKTGYGGYGPLLFNRGARVLQFNTTGNDVTMNSWIREENGKIEDSQWKFPKHLKLSQNECAGMKPHEDAFIKTTLEARD